MAGLHQSPSILENGRLIMDKYMEQYLEYEGSVVVPPVFHDKAVDYMENITEPKDGQQRVINSQKGDYAERLVHNALNTTTTIAGTNFVALNSFKITRNKIKFIKDNFPDKSDALENFMTTYFQEEYEADFIVVLQNMGIAIIEVKSSLDNKAYKQLNRSEVLIKDFIELVFPESMNVPIIKILAMPTTSDCDIHGKKYGYLCLTKDDFATPQWQEMIISELLDLKKDKQSDVQSVSLLQRVLFYLLSPIYNIFGIFTIPKCVVATKYYDFDECFLKLTELLVGVWCLNTAEENNPKFNSEKCSSGYWIKEINQKLCCAVLSEKSGTTKANKPHNPDFITFVEKTLRQAFNIQYLTTQQKELLFDENNTHVALDGPAGSGKTICLLMKIALLLKKNKDAKVVLITTANQSENCAKVLKKCKISSSVDPGISELGSPRTNVLIVTLTVGNIAHKSDLEYNINTLNILGLQINDFISQLPSFYHVLIDEYQLIESYATAHINLGVPEVNENQDPRHPTAHENLGVAEVIKSHSQRHPTFWLCYDLLQHSFSDMNNRNRRSDISQSIRYICEDLRAISLPNILRNTVELSALLQVFHDRAYDQLYSGIEPSTVATVGHNIHAFNPVIYYIPNLNQIPQLPKLTQYFGECAVSEIRKLMKYPNLNLCDIAVLVNGGFSVNIQAYMTESGFNVQSIQEYSVNPRPDAIVCDLVINSFSFEWPIVFLFCTGSLTELMQATLYFGSSRARVMLWMFLGYVDKELMEGMSEVADVRPLRIEMWAIDLLSMSAPFYFNRHQDNSRSAVLNRVLCLETE